MPVFRVAAIAVAASSVFAAVAQVPAAVPASAASAPAAAAPVDNSALDAPLLYQLLIGEIELNEGEAGTAFQVLLDAARKTRDERLFKRAVEVALQAKAGDQALEAARAWRQTLPSSIEAHRYEVQLLVALNRVAEATEPLRATLALVPPDQRATAIGSLPGYFARATDRKATSAVLEQVLLPYAEGKVKGETADTPVAAWIALGRSRLTAGDNAGALQAAQRAQALAPDAEAVALLAVELIPTQPQAEDLVKSYLRAESPSASTTRSAVRLVYARALAVAQRYAEAAPQIEAVTKEAPQFTDAWLTLGALRLELKQPEAAEAALKDYLARTESAAPAQPERASPESEDDDAATPAQRMTQAYLLLAQAAQQRNDYKAAESWLSKVDSSQALAVQMRRASLLAQQGKVDEARALIRKLPERSQEDTRAKLLAESQLLRDLRRWKEALTLLSDANQRIPNDADLLYEEAMVAEKLDRMADMEQLLRRVIALKPTQSQAYNALGYSLADRNQRLPEAHQLIQKALELSPGDPFLVDSLGWVEYRQGNHDAAVRLLQQAYRARPDIEIAAHLGEVLWVSGKRDEARRVLAEARARDAGNDVLKETLARLKVDL